MSESAFKQPRTRTRRVRERHKTITVERQESAFRVRGHHVAGHFINRNGKRIWIPPHYVEGYTAHPKTMRYTEKRRSYPEKVAVGPGSIKSGRHGRRGEVREYVRPHVSHDREGDAVHVRGFTREEPVRRFGGNFNEVSAKIAREYERKGYSKEEADRIGRETAADVYRHKLAKG